MANGPSLTGTSGQPTVVRLTNRRSRSRAKALQPSTEAGTKFIDHERMSTDATMDVGECLGC